MVKDIWRDIWYRKEMDCVFSSVHSWSIQWWHAVIPPNKPGGRKKLHSAWLYQVCVKVEEHW